jgi:hypothetical protein
MSEVRILSYNEVCTGYANDSEFVTKESYLTEKARADRLEIDYRHLKDVKQNYFEEIQKLKDDNTRLREALKATYKQRFGMDNNWSGMWKRCESISCAGRSMTNPASLYAYGGNWESSEKMCPQCQAREALEHT